MKWKPTAAEKKAIRGFAARSERRKPMQLHIEIGGRWNGEIENTNVLLVDSTEHWEKSDLNQTWPWSDLSYGIDLTPNGLALVDFYVYEKEFGDHGELLTNVQAHVALHDGKPVLWKITGTGAKDEVLDFHVAALLAAELVGAGG